MESLGHLLEERKRRKQVAKMEGSLAEFFREAWREVLERDRSLTWSWHYDYLAEVLESISSGGFKNQHPELLGVIICVPPRTSKSGLVNVAWPAWSWIDRPWLRFLCGSYSGTLSTDHSIKRRNLILSRWYQSRWGSRFTLSPDLNRTDDYANDQTGRATATSVGGTVTGLGGDVCIGDDLLNQDDQFSEAARKATNRWIDGTWGTKLNNPSTGVFVYIQQRLHEDDPPGHLLEQRKDAWLHIRIPLEAEENETYVFPITKRIVQRTAGDILQPGRFTPAVVKTLKDSPNWTGQYQQRPSPEQGGIIKKFWWRYYVRPGDAKPEGCLVLPDDFDEMAQSWDMSFKDKKTSDFVCGGVWGRVSAMKYLMPDIVWDRLDFPATKKAVRALSARWPKTYAKWIEDKANGTAIIAELQTEISGLIPVEPMGSKEARLHAAAPDVEAGNVVLPHPSIAPWVHKFVDECAAACCGGKHDDAADMMAQAINKLRTNLTSGWLLQGAAAFKVSEHRPNKAAEPLTQSDLARLSTDAGKEQKEMSESRLHAIGKLPRSRVFGEEIPDTINKPTEVTPSPIDFRKCPVCENDKIGIAGDYRWCVRCGWNNRKDNALNQPKAKCGIACPECGNPNLTVIGEWRRCNGCGWESRQSIAIRTKGSQAVTKPYPENRQLTA
jgi:predicted phage terminase large subunit-like protein